MDFAQWYMNKGSEIPEQLKRVDEKYVYGYDKSSQ